MNILSLFLSASGRLHRRHFLFAVLAVYALALLSHVLTAPPVVQRLTFLPFMAAQVFLLWSWYALHAKRLRDAGQTAGLPAAVAVIYLLAFILLMMIFIFFLKVAAQSTASGDTLPSPSVLAFAMLMFLFGSLGERLDLDLLGSYLLMLAIPLVPLALIIGVSIWTATRPSAAPS